MEIDAAYEDLKKQMQDIRLLLDKNEKSQNTVANNQKKLGEGMDAILKKISSRCL